MILNHPAMLKRHVLSKALARSYRDKLKELAQYHANGDKNNDGLFSIPMPELPEITEKNVDSKKAIQWRSDSYVGHGAAPADFMAFDQPAFSKIQPRVEKAQADKKARTKAKAEVFTPSWVCCLQNDLVDDAVLYEGAFSVVNSQSKTWTINPEPIDFSKSSDKLTWIDYVLSRRLEITCGEGPYLFSRYDTVSGDAIPVRGEDGSFQRIGILDRKFRVIFENMPADLSSETREEWWVTVALEALKSTYGYEWQGDNLVLARQNMLLTFMDYFKDSLGADREPSAELIDQVVEIISWQLWQMDGLKCVVPESCSDECDACAKKQRFGHDGLAPVIRWGKQLIPFERLLVQPS